MSAQQRGSQRKHTVKAYAFIALGLVTFGSLCLYFSIDRYRVVMNSAGYSSDPQHWGYFGDFVGGFAGTLIALLTLIALAITIWIQGTELTETRDQLTRAADAATAQIELTRIYESRRIQPMIKVEWHHVKDYTIGMRFTNVGLGPAVLDEIEFPDEPAPSRCHHVMDIETALLQWRATLRIALADSYPGDQGLALVDVNESMRVLAMGEPQFAVFVNFTSEKYTRTMTAVLNSAVRPIVHFHSLSGQRWTTVTQLSTVDELLNTVA